jgi:hypothetical protein
MQRDDGDHDRQTEAVTGQTSAAIETVEALDDPGALGRRDAGAVVLNYQGDGVGFFGCPNPYRRPLPGPSSSTTKETVSVSSVARTRTVARCRHI